MSNKIKLAITGGTGFLGKYFIQEYKEKYNIVIIARTKRENSKNMEIRETDYSIESLKQVLHDCDAILHLAAERLYQRQSTDFLHNLKIDHNVFTCANQYNIENIVFASTIGVYGSSSMPWTEWTTPQPDNLYALAKYQSEIAAQYFNRQGMYIKILRIAQVFGLGEYKHSVISTFIDNCVNNRPLQIKVKGIHREYIYIKDLIRAFDIALSNPNKHGIFNVGTGVSATIEELALTIAKAFRKLHLVQIHKNIQVLDQKTLMDSSLFMKTFHWRPTFSLEKAAEDIAYTLQEEKEVFDGK